jgi:MYXO-CTERM domain-containing protein
MTPANTDGASDNRPTSSTATRTTTACPTATRARTAPTAPTPMLPSAMANANCPGVGATCDPTRGVCVAAPPPDAGPDAALDASAPDVAPPDASAPDVAPPDASAPDVADDLGTLDGGLPSRVIYRGGGCGCDVPGAAPRAPFVGSLLALGAALALRRRRR